MAHYSSVSVHRLSWRGLIPQFVIMIILPVMLLLVIIPLGSLTLHQSAMRDLVAERDERTARSVARAIGEQLNHRATAMQSLMLRLGDRVSPAEVLATSGFLLPDFDGGLAFYTANGNQLAAVGNRQILTGRDLTDLLGRATPESIFSAPLTDSTTGEVFLMIAASTDRTTIAVGTFSVTVVARSTLADAFITGGEASAFVIDQHYQAVYQTGTLPLSRPGAEHPGIKEALRGESGTTYMQQTAGNSEHVVAYSPIAPLGWALVIEEQWDHVASPLLRTTQFAPLILIPPFFLSLVTLWFGVRQIVRPLQTLATRATALAWGHFEAIEEPVDGIAEVRRLQTELIHMAHKVKAAQESLRDYISAITAGQEDERRRLARELHDDTLQALIALNQRTQLARLSLADSPASAQLAEIQELTEQTIANLRRLTRALRPIYLEDLGLVTALEMLARETSQNTKLPVAFHRIGQERRLSSEVELALYRMTQEALSNVARHAHASQVSLTVQFKPETVTVTVADNGRGFVIPETPSAFAKQGHFGLLGLQERAELVAARLSIQSAPGHGTQVTIDLPTASAAA